jgi:hypothetical protein
MRKERSGCENVFFDAFDVNQRGFLNPGSKERHPFEEGQTVKQNHTVCWSASSEASVVNQRGIPIQAVKQGHLFAEGNPVRKERLVRCCAAFGVLNLP